MNRILLTSTALVMVAGIAAADGHASVSWSGTATAGVARNGGSAAKAAVAAAATAVEKTDWEAHITANAAVRGSLNALTVGGALVAVADTNAAAQADAAEIASMRLAVAQTLVRATAAANGNAVVIAAAEAAAAAQTATLTHVYGSAAVAAGTAGDFQAYSEVNATVTGAVTAGGITLSAGMSVDAGNGYDFADDDTFDTARTNGVSLDSVSVDMGSAGKITLDQDATTHLVDGDDDASGDVKYTNTFGGATFTAVLDLDKNDSDIIASNAAAGAPATTTTAAVTQTAAVAAKAGVAIGDWVPGAAAVAADTQWSAKVSMPLGGGSVYVAMDEESGNAFGGTAMVSGATVSIDSKIEALAADLKGLRATTLGVSYPMGALTAGATYDSIKDGDQWGVSASYAAGDMTVGFSTDEGSDWSVTGAYALGTGATINAGVNYTEDAFLGLSFAF
jgi:hypothetical protein